MPKQQEIGTNVPPIDTSAPQNPMKQQDVSIYTNPANSQGGGVKPPIIQVIDGSSNTPNKKVL